MHPCSNSPNTVAAASPTSRGSKRDLVLVAFIVCSLPNAVLSGAVKTQREQHEVILLCALFGDRSVSLDLNEVAGISQTRDNHEGAGRKLVFRKEVGEE